MIKSRFTGKIAFFTVFLLLSNSFLHAQSASRDMFIFKFENNFEDDQSGNYLMSDYTRDWNNPVGTQRQSEMDILSEGNGYGKFMRGYFPVGTIGPSSCGWSWDTYLPGENTEMYFSYDIRFKPGFEWVLGGKIPGISGGIVKSGFLPQNGDGFSARLIWAEGGRLKFYVYHMDRKTIYGDPYFWDNFKFNTGQWYNITIRIVLNSVTNNVGNNDGILEGFIDGKLVIQLKNFRFRNFNNIYVDNIYNCSFFGGNTAEFNSLRDEWIDTDNYFAYTYSSQVSNVPRNHELSSWSTILLHPYHNFAATEWKKYLNVTSLESAKVSLAWTDYPYPTDYIAERSEGDQSTFTAIATLSYGTKSFVDTDVVPGKKYTYRLRADNTTSDVVTVTTPLMDLTSPSGLSASKIDASSVVLKWVDNSTNETGFELERSGPGDFNIKKSIATAANITTLTDNDIQPNSDYQYRIRAKNTGGVSAYTPLIAVKSAIVQPPPPQPPTIPANPPSAPSLLKSKDFTEKSITLRWNDNSTDETGFIIERGLAIDPKDFTQFELGANDTSFVDDNLASNTTYVYSVRAVNLAGLSPVSNKGVASTLSVAETKRFRDGLIAYYNFGYDPFNVIRDLSNYSNPVDLKILQPNSIQWNEYGKLQIKSNTTLVSTAPAEKIVCAVKKTNQLTVECWIKPDEPFASNVARIASLGTDKNDVGFVLDQYYNSQESKSLNYASRLTTSSTTEEGFPEIVSEDVNAYINLQHVAFVHDSLGNESMYINGKLAASGFRSDGLDNWKTSYNLRLGNEADQSLPWTGTYYIMAIYNTALNSQQIQRNYEAGPCENMEVNGMKYDINLYPNPATDFVNINFTPSERLENIMPTMIRLQDLTGKIIFQETVFNPNDEYQKELDVRNLPKGMYIIQITSGKESQASKLIVQ